ncbi:DUF4125 family protein [Desulfovibrio sp. JC010]|uniref:DUF4125 family protein n=1 Tax=Desulfovibrio sp. JC010 TaxID=2593641 RepID=UPI0013D30AB9|nr:DUF4125 family protein [Desulfovibrio sp. JC010]NDV27081.1 DUF4125 family protein [Desulfovibrio sp. JC010]
MAEDKRIQIIENIIALELDMFLAVKNRGGTAACQEHPDSFRIMRNMTHGVMPDDYLESYLADLEKAVADKRNLMTEKYALMEGLIPVQNDSPAIAAIVQLESEWRKEVAAQFPRAVHPDGHQSFCIYLGSELQTYSSGTLDIYLNYARSVQQKHGNLVRERYEILMRKLGYESLTHCEESLSKPTK